MRRLLVVALAVLAGCSTATKTATPVTPSATLTTVAPAATTTTVDYPGLQRQYLAAVAPANTATATFNAAAAKLPASTTAAAYVAIMTPFADALAKMDTALLAIQAPPAVTADIRAMVTADAAMEGDLRGFAGATALNSGTLLSTITRDAATDHAASAIVRTDLHLPPVST